MTPRSWQATRRRPSSPAALFLRTLLTTLLLTALPGPRINAQDSSGKPPLPIADYRLWRSIDGATLSPDGAWAGWSYSRERGDDTLHVVSLDSDGEHVVPLASEPAFSDDGKWVAFFISPSFTEAEKLRRKKETVTRKAGLLNLASGEQLTWEDAAAFAFAKGSSHLVVKKRRPDEKAEFQGSDLILRNLGAGYDEFIGRVDEYGFNKPGTLFAYTVDAADQDGNGLYLVSLPTGTHRVLDSSKERYGKLSWAEEGKGLAVLHGEVPEGKVHRANTLVAFTDLDSATPRRFAFQPGSGAGLPDGHVISENGNLQWSEGLGTLFVGTRVQEDSLKAWPEDALPLADVNVWHWADEVIQPAQQKGADRERRRTYLAAVHLDDGRVVPLADTLMRSVEVTRDGRWGIGEDPTPYISDWEPSYADVYRVDPRTGARAPVLTKQLRSLGLSPDSRHFLYWKEGDVWLYPLAADTHRNLTASAPVDFTDMEFDQFGERPPYGVGGWTKDGNAVLLYHRYDVWLQPLDGSAARNLTGGRGAQDEIRFRYVRTDPEERAIDMSKPLLLSAYGEWTKKEGFFELRRGDLREIAWEDRKFGRPQKAEKADRYLFTVQTFQEFPDLWVSGRDFSDRDRVTVANPQQSEYRWGHRILFDYTNADGVPLQGTLAIPDGYQEGQKLPMIVRFYEKYSQDLHVYPNPMYRHQPNFAGYVSNGYLLMMPDIHFRLGTSHSDMLECVEAAVRKVIELGYADPAAVGLSGHSYSGGGGAYIATRSRMFAAIAHGAAPINLVSEFNQLFVGSGENNHQYDIYGQGRYATNPYDDFQLYWDQSPISGVEEMDTPVLYLHGEADPTVNFEQGWEWYNALRFLGKPIIFLSYPGEGHGLSRLENKIDFQYRLREFFDHHLKGAPAPSWMTEGVPFLQKDRSLREYAPKVFPPPPDTVKSGGPVR